MVSEKKGENMRLKASKSKMHSLIADKEENNLPKMKDSEFRSYKGTYWLEFRDTKTDHLMKVCLDKCAGSVHLLIDDKTEETSRIIKLSLEEMVSRDMIEYV